MRDTVKDLMNSWAPAVITTSGITILSLIKVETPSLILPELDFLKHFLAYLVLSIVLHFPMRIRTEMSRVAQAVLIIAICSIYGVIMELAQNLVPGRDCDILDAVANSTGAIIGQILVFAAERIFWKKPE